MAASSAASAILNGLSRATPRVTAFCGLGVMGYPIAGQIARKVPGQTLVWSRTMAKAERHSQEFGSVCASNGFKDFAEVDVVLMCLPTSAEDAAVTEAVAPFLKPGASIVSCTSGVPDEARNLAASIYKRFGVHFMDAPVSGGPAGAEAGTLACMMGADDEEAAQRAIEVCKTFTSKVVRTGPVGSACAVKSINNVMNSAHLLLASEGLLALQQMGVCPEVALSVINSSSGRSLQTEVRLPKEVLSRNFNYGFKLPLMAKDTRIAEKVLKAGYPKARLLPMAAQLVQEAASKNPDADADYTRAVCLLEQEAGKELRPASRPERSNGHTHATETEAPAAKRQRPESTAAYAHQ